MINFEKTFAAILGNISEKEVKKLGKNNDTCTWVRSSTAESALAGAYIWYLENQGIKLTKDQEDYLSSKIESSLKRYKTKAKNINN